ncbi:heavy metal translocating P-type ATPase [Yoonia sp.]|uniref:heavy metal translocating P-type ATPase n=1 Tax=Yoonia sp. TaxID=2212373 RepID=UPI0019F665DE|nr:heavy metal translocating P-type ATPase [Yoonia sp.]MBE0412974.1 cadmium-translocating P-type ATPase [Yoonia sp.]
MSSAMSACPACSAAPLALDTAKRHMAEAGSTVLSLPDIHCAACIGAVEQALHDRPDVRAARVNLSRKRVTIDAPGVPVADLIETLANVGFAASELNNDLLGAADRDPRGNALLVRMAVAGFAMMNVMLFSVAVWSGANDSTAKMFHWISAAISVPVLAFSAQVFFQSAWSALRVWRVNMDVPISLAIILAAALSIYETALGSGHVYFDAALALTFFLLAGRYLDHRTRAAARSAAQELTALETPRATRLVDGHREDVRVSALAVGDVIAVPVGMRCPVDGQIATGESTLDRSLITGESRAVAVAPGDRLSAGEINLTSPLTITVGAVGEDTTLRRMAALVEAAEGARNRYTALADRAAKNYAPVVHLLALGTFTGWMILTGDIPRSMNIAISVLIITCPCALGLAVPAVMTAATGRFFRHGMLVKDGTAIERLAEIDTVVFDKTGTLTKGQAAFDVAGMSDQARSVLKALTNVSDHPVARALGDAMARSVTPAPLSDVTEHPGQGISARWNGVRVRLGSAAWIGGGTSPVLAIGDDPLIPLELTETLRPGSIEAVTQVIKSGRKVMLLSGDNHDAVEKVARALGIADWHAAVHPHEKLDIIKSLQASGQRVLMVGDGLNDTAALTQAEASMSPATALDAARTASDIVLISESLSALPEAISTAQNARRRVIENFAISAGYNMVVIPIAVMGFASPLGAAIAMSVSSITVLLNALRVR